MGASTTEQLSLRQEIYLNCLSFDNEDGKFNYLVGELERLANKLPYSKKDEYYKSSDNMCYYNDEWNK